MSNVYGRYMLDADVLTPMGMNLGISLAIAKADLARFSQLESEDGLERFSYAKAEFIKGDQIKDRVIEMTDTLMDSMLNKLPKSLKPVSVIVSIPKAIEPAVLTDWFEGSRHEKWVSKVDISHQGGPGFFHQCLAMLDKQDAVICLSLDSPYSQIDELISQGLVMSNHQPWGLLPSEGGAGVIFTKKNIVDTLKLKPIARLEYFIGQSNPADRRGMMALVRKATESFEHMGEVYCDMIHSRAHTEDYGFALGARSEAFVNGENPILINNLWGSLGRASSLALLGAFSHLHRSSDSASLMMFDNNGDRGLLKLSMLDYRQIGG
ncbi:hypothetical protein ACFFUP_09525 [Vibrio ostreicida]|uniref:3-oxoacyl-ACP synthase n=2 Tax=Vibrio ostreicida TaxID=526588 RepID=A0ABT8C0B7_9VIBR|nr:hypothetical protein [Vibrio ostreicida]MDN3611783.1 hypothetical protein [Vibrio ostreicida]NPD09598.1 hypothetical protein [Vibrio ostreicida]